MATDKNTGLGSPMQSAPTEAIHGWFGLSYANYLVVPRAVLQSMPDEWQERFVALMSDMTEAFGHLDWPIYDVRVFARPPEMVREEDCPECEGEGTVTSDTYGEQPCEECAGEGVIECDPHYETAEEVGLRDDPIPSYNRGRTRIPPMDSNV